MAVFDDICAISDRCFRSLKIRDHLWKRGFSAGKITLGPIKIFWVCAHGRAFMKMKTPQIMGCVFCATLCAQPTKQKNKNLVHTLSYCMLSLCVASCYHTRHVAAMLGTPTL